MMSLGLIGRKVGMTRIFTDDGTSVPVSVIDVSGNRVTQIKSAGTDGYSAVQMTCGERRVSRVTKALAGHYSKAGVEAGRAIKEFVASADQISQFTLGVWRQCGYFSGWAVGRCNRYNPG